MCASWRGWLSRGLAAAGSAAASAASSNLIRPGHLRPGRQPMALPAVCLLPRRRRTCGLRRPDYRRGGPHLLEACAAIHGFVGPRREWHACLAAAPRADRGVVLARAVRRRPGAPRGRSTRWASGRVVDQPLAGKERLLACGEHERFSAVATGQRPVDEHHQASPPPSPSPSVSAGRIRSPSRVVVAPAALWCTLAPSTLDHPTSRREPRGA